MGSQLIISPLAALTLSFCIWAVAAPVIVLGLPDALRLWADWLELL